MRIYNNKGKKIQRRNKKSQVGVPLCAVTTDPSVGMKDENTEKPLSSENLNLKELLIFFYFSSW